MRELSKWMLALLEAYSRGEAPWLFINGQNQAVLAWNDGGNAAAILVATEHGVTPQKYPPTSILKR